MINMIQKQQHFDLKIENFRAEKDELQPSQHQNQRNSELGNDAQDERYRSKSCREKIKYHFDNLRLRLLNYMEYDQYLDNTTDVSNQDVMKIYTKHFANGCQKRYAEDFHSSYSEREKNFGYTFEEVLIARQDEILKKQKNFWVQLKRFLCCEGGNQMQQVQDIDQQRFQMKGRKSRLQTEQSLMIPNIRSEVYSAQISGKKHKQPVKNNVFDYNIELQQHYVQPYQTDLDQQFQNTKQKVKLRRSEDGTNNRKFEENSYRLNTKGNSDRKVSQDQQKLEGDANNKNWQNEGKSNRQKQGHDNGGNGVTNGNKPPSFNQEQKQVKVNLQDPNYKGKQTRGKRVRNLNRVVVHGNHGQHTDDYNYISNQKNSNLQKQIFYSDQEQDNNEQTPQYVNSSNFTNDYGKAEIRKSGKSQNNNIQAKYSINNRQQLTSTSPQYDNPHSNRHSQNNSKNVQFSQRLVQNSKQHDIQHQNHQIDSIEIEESYPEHKFSLQLNRKKDKKQKRKKIIQSKIGLNDDSFRLQQDFQMQQGEQQQYENNYQSQLSAFRQCPNTQPIKIKKSKRDRSKIQMQNDQTFELNLELKDNFIEGDSPRGKAANALKTKKKKTISHLVVNQLDQIGIDQLVTETDQYEKVTKSPSRTGVNLHNGKEIRQKGDQQFVPAERKAEKKKRKGKKQRVVQKKVLEQQTQVYEIQQM